MSLKTHLTLGDSSKGKKRAMMFGNVGGQRSFSRLKVHLPSAADSWHHKKGDEIENAQTFFNDCLAVIFYQLLNSHGLDFTCS